MTKKIVLSDVDGTITTGSLVLNHATMLHNTGVIDLGALPSKWAADKKNEELISALAQEYRSGIVGMALEDFLIEDFLTTQLSDSANFYSTLDRLVSYKNDGADVVLISGSPDYLVEAFASRFGFEGVGSTYTIENGVFNGDVMGMFHADAKRKHISGMNLTSYDTIHALGDTQSDAPLFEVAHWSVLVEPSTETFEALGSKVQEVLYF